VNLMEMNDRLESNNYTMKTAKEPITNFMYDTKTGRTKARDQKCLVRSVVSLLMLLYNLPCFLHVDSEGWLQGRYDM